MQGHGAPEPGDARARLVPERSSASGARSRSPRGHRHASVHQPHGLEWQEACLASAKDFYARRLAWSAGSRQVASAQGIVFYCKALCDHNAASPFIGGYQPLVRFNAASCKLAALLADVAIAHAALAEHAPPLLEEARQQLAATRNEGPAWLRSHDPEGIWTHIALGAMANQIRSITAELPTELRGQEHSVEADMPQQPPS